MRITFVALAFVATLTTGINGCSPRAGTGPEPSASEQAAVAARTAVVTAGELVALGYDVTAKVVESGVIKRDLAEKLREKIALAKHAYGLARAALIAGEWGNALTQATVAKSIARQVVVDASPSADDVEVVI